MVGSGRKFSKMVGNGQKWVVIKDSEWTWSGGYGVVRSGRKLSRVVGSSRKWSEMFKNGWKWSEMGSYKR